MKIKQIFSVLALAALSLLISCKPKDSELQKSANNLLIATPGISAKVKNGVATLTGNVTNVAAVISASNAIAKIKGITSVSNKVSITILPPSMPPVDILSKAVNKLIKDIPSVSAIIADSVISVKGELSASKWKALKIALIALHPQKLIDSNIIVK